MFFSYVRIVFPARMFLSPAHLVCPAHLFAHLLCSSRLPSSYVRFICSSRLPSSYVLFTCSVRLPSSSQLLFSSSGGSADHNDNNNPSVAILAEVIQPRRARAMAKAGSRKKPAAAKVTVRRKPSAPRGPLEALPLALARWCWGAAECDQLKSADVPRTLVQIQQQILDHG